LARELGTAFQIRDDCLIWTSAGVAGKPTRDDLREGKLGYPVLRARERLPPSEADELGALFRTARSDESAADRIERLVVSSGAVVEGLALADEMLSGAATRLRALAAGAGEGGTDATRALFELVAVLREGLVVDAKGSATSAALVDYVERAAAR
jgi:geranylgeranyl pyrophosphate synthase